MKKRAAWTAWSKWWSRTIRLIYPKKSLIDFSSDARRWPWRFWRSARSMFFSRGISIGPIMAAQSNDIRRTAFRRCSFRRAPRPPSGSETRPIHSIFSRLNRTVSEFKRWSGKTEKIDSKALLKRYSSRVPPDGGKARAREDDWNRCVKKVASEVILIA